MRGWSRKLTNTLPVLITIIGVAMIILALLVDSLGIGGEPGLGTKQLLALIFGIFTLPIGAVLLIPASRHYLRDWRVPQTMLDKPEAILLIAAWFGLFTAFGELAILGEHRFIQNGIIHRGLLVLWALPLTEVIFFGSIGIILLLFTKQFPKLAKIKVASLVFPFMAYLSIFLMFPRIYILADILLASGLALQTSQIATSHLNGFFFLIYHTLGWMRLPSSLVFRKPLIEQGPQAQNESTISRRDFLVTMGVTLGGLAVGVSGFDQIVEKSKLASLRISSKRSLNVLLIVLDTVRAKSLSLYGYEKPTTPQLERIAKNGTLFENARANAPWTLPSHASMFTGRYPHELSCGWVEPLDATYPTLAEVLVDAGYETAGFVANLDYCIREFGLNRGFIHYEDYRASIGELIGDTALSGAIARELLPSLGDHQILGRKNAASINNDFLSWLDQRKVSHPFFAFLNYYDAHDPYIPPADFARKFMMVPSSGVVQYNKMDTISPEETRGLSEAYDASIAYIDHQVGLLYDELARRGILDDTFVIITADHGEQFGEHKLYSHGNSLYRPLLYVPLLLLLPGKVPGRTFLNNEVSLHEIPATVVDLLGIKTNLHFPGASFSRFWLNARGNKQDALPLISEVQKGIGTPTWYPGSKGAMAALIYHEIKYIMNSGTGMEELYDLKSDPQEQNNLAFVKSDQDTLSWFRSSLDKMLKTNNDANS
jgi:arylsulfatase A-like enzyme